MLWRRWSLALRRMLLEQCNLVGISNPDFAVTPLAAIFGCNLKPAPGFQQSQSATRAFERHFKRA